MSGNNTKQNIDLFSKARGFSQKIDNSYGNLPYSSGAPELTTENFPVSTYNPYISKYGNYSPYTVGLDDYRARNQGFMQKAWRGTERFIAGTGLKFLQGVGYLGGLAGFGNTSDEWGGNWIAGAADNGLAKWSENSEKWFKEKWAPLYNESGDKLKNPFSRMFTDADFWFDEAVDGLAFMASTWLPAGIISKIGKGAALGRFIAGTGSKFLRAAEVGEKAMWLPKLGGKTAAAIDLVGQTAFMTSTESMFEAKEVRDNVYEKMKNSINPETGKLYTEQEARKSAGNAAKDTFGMNMLALSFSNFLEAKMIMGLGKASRAGEGIAIAGKRAGFGTTGDIASEAVSKNLVGRFLNSRKGEILKGLTGGIAREGLYEENIQHAIQQVNEAFGVHNVHADFLTKAGGVLGSIKPSSTSYSETDRQTNILLGGILGGGMSMVASNREYNQNKAKRNRDISNINSTYNTFRNLDIFERENDRNIETFEEAQQDGSKKYFEQINGGTKTEISQQRFQQYSNDFNQTTKDDQGNDIYKAGKFTVAGEYKLDKDGRRIVDPAKKAAYAAEFQSNVEFEQVMTALSENPSEKGEVMFRAMRAKQFDKFAIAMIEAGQTSELMDLLDRYENANEEDAQQFAIDNPADYKKNIGKLKERVKKLEDISNTIEYETGTGSATQAFRKTYLKTLAADMLTIQDELDKVNKEMPSLVTAQALEEIKQKQERAKKALQKKSKFETASTLGQTLRGGEKTKQKIDQEIADLQQEGYLDNTGQAVDKYSEELRKSPDGLKWKLKKEMSKELENTLQDLQKEWNKVIDPLTGLKYYTKRVLSRMNRRGTNILIDENTTPENYIEYENALIRGKYLQYLFDQSLREFSEQELQIDIDTALNAVKDSSSSPAQKALAITELMNIAQKVLDKKYFIRLSNNNFNEIFTLLNNVLDIINRDEFDVAVSTSLDAQEALREMQVTMSDFDSIKDLLEDLVEIHFSNSTLPNKQMLESVVNNLQNNKDKIVNELPITQDTLPLRKDIADDLHNKAKLVLQKAKSEDNFSNNLLSEVRKNLAFLKNLKRIFEERNKKKETIDDEQINILNTDEFKDFVPNIDSSIKELETKEKEITNYLQDRSKADENYNKDYVKSLFRVLGIDFDKDNNKADLSEYPQAVQDFIKNFSGKIEKALADAGLKFEDLINISKKYNTTDLIKSIGLLLLDKGKDEAFIQNLIQDLNSDLEILYKNFKTMSFGTAVKNSFVDNVGSQTFEDAYENNPVKTFQVIIHNFMFRNNFIKAYTAKGTFYDTFKREGNFNKLIDEIKKEILAKSNEPDVVNALKEMLHVVQIHAAYMNARQIVNDLSSETDAFSNLLAERKALLVEIENQKTGKTFQFSPTRQQRIVLSQLFSWFEGSSMLGFLQGAAGTGKTNLLVRLFIKVMGINTDEIITGGRDLDTHAKTINDSITPTNTPRTIVDITKLLESNDTALEKTKIIIIDEIGVETADNIDNLVKALEKYNKNNNKNIKLLTLGDPHQLSVDKSGSSIVFNNIPKMTQQTKYFSLFMEYFNQLTIVFRTNVGAITSFANLFRDNPNNVFASELFLETSSEDIVTDNPMFGVNTSNNFEEDIKNLASVNPTRSKAIITTYKNKQKYLDFVNSAGIANKVKVYTYDECAGLTIDEVYIDMQTDEEFGQDEDLMKNYNTSMYQAISRATNFVLLNKVVAKQVVNPELKNTNTKASQDFKQRQQDHLNEINEGLKALKEAGLSRAQTISGLDETKSADEPAPKGKTEPTNPAPTGPSPENINNGVAPESTANTSFVDELNASSNIQDLWNLLQKPDSYERYSKLEEKDKQRFRAAAKTILERKGSLFDKLFYNLKHRTKKELSRYYNQIETDKQKEERFYAELFDLQGNYKLFRNKPKVDFFFIGDKLNLKAFDHFKDMLDKGGITPKIFMDLMVELGLNNINAPDVVVKTFGENGRVGEITTGALVVKPALTGEYYTIKAQKAFIRLQGILGNNFNKLVSAIETKFGGLDSAAKFPFQSGLTFKNYVAELRKNTDPESIEIADDIQYILDNSIEQDFISYLNTLLSKNSHFSEMADTIKMLRSLPRLKDVKVLVFTGDLNKLKNRSIATSNGFAAAGNISQIVVLQDQNNNEFTTTIMHESLHLLVDNLIATSPEFRTVIHDIRNTFIKNYNGSLKHTINYPMSQFRDITDPHATDVVTISALREFVVGALSNPLFQQELKTVTYDKQRTVFDAIIETILSFLFPNKTDKNAYTAMFLETAGRVFTSESVWNTVESQLAMFALKNKKTVGDLTDKQLNDFISEFIENDPTNDNSIDPTNPIEPTREEIITTEAENDNKQDEIPQEELQELEKERKNLIEEIARKQKELEEFESINEESFYEEIERELEEVNKQIEEIEKELKAEADKKETESTQNSSTESDTIINTNNAEREDFSMFDEGPFEKGYMVGTDKIYMQEKNSPTPSLFKIKIDPKDKNLAYVTLLDELTKQDLKDLAEFATDFEKIWFYKKSPSKNQVPVITSPGIFEKNEDGYWLAKERIKVKFVDSDNLSLSQTSSTSLSEVNLLLEELYAKKAQLEEILSGRTIETIQESIKEIVPETIEIIIDTKEDQPITKEEYVAVENFIERIEEEFKEEELIETVLGVTTEDKVEIENSPKVKPFKNFIDLLKKTIKTKGNYLIGFSTKIISIIKKYIKAIALSAAVFASIYSYNYGTINTDYQKKHIEKIVESSNFIKSNIKRLDNLSKEQKASLVLATKQSGISIDGTIFSLVSKYNNGNLEQNSEFYGLAKVLSDLFDDTPNLYTADIKYLENISLTTDFIDLGTCKAGNECAAYVQDVFQHTKVLAPVLSNQGLFGNAWQMPINVVNNGGEFIYNFFDKEGQSIKSTKGNKSAILSQINKQKHNDKELQDYSPVEGDIIGLFNPNSDNHVKAYSQNKKDGYNAYNTHVGFIRFVGDKAFVEHNVHGNIIRTSLSDILNNSSTYKIASIARPSYLKGTPFFINTNKKDISLIENLPERHLYKKYDAGQAFGREASIILAKAKEEAAKITNDQQEQNLIVGAVYVLSGQESSFGTDRLKVREQLVINLAKDILGNASHGIYQIQARLLNEAGISSDYGVLDLYDINKSTEIAAKIVKYYINKINENNKKQFDNLTLFQQIALLAHAHNRGVEKYSSANALNNIQNRLKESPLYEQALFRAGYLNYPNLNLNNERKAFNNFKERKFDWSGVQSATQISFSKTDSTESNKSKDIIKKLTSFLSSLTTLAMSYESLLTPEISNKIGDLSNKILSLGNKIKNILEDQTNKQTKKENLKNEIDTLQQKLNELDRKIEIKKNATETNQSSRESEFTESLDNSDFKYLLVDDEVLYDNKIFNIIKSARGAAIKFGKMNLVLNNRTSIAVTPQLKSEIEKRKQAEAERKAEKQNKVDQIIEENEIVENNPDTEDLTPEQAEHVEELQDVYNEFNLDEKDKDVETDQGSYIYDDQAPIQDRDSSNHYSQHPNNSAFHQSLQNSIDTIDSVRPGDEIIFINTTYVNDEGDLLNGIQAVAPAYKLVDGQRVLVPNLYIEVSVEGPQSQSPFSALFERELNDSNRTITNLTRDSSTNNRAIFAGEIRKNSIVARGTLGSKSSNLKFVYNKKYSPFSTQALKDVIKRFVNTFFFMLDSNQQNEKYREILERDNHVVKIFNKIEANKFNQEHYEGESYIKPGIPYIIIYETTQPNASTKSKPLFIKLTPRRLQETDEEYKTLEDLYKNLEELKNHLSKVITDEEVLYWFINSSETFSELIKASLKNTVTEKRKYKFNGFKYNSKNPLTLLEAVDKELSSKFPDKTSSFNFFSNPNNDELLTEIIDRFAVVGNLIYETEVVTRKGENVLKLKNSGKAQLAFDQIAASNLIVYDIIVNENNIPTTLRAALLAETRKVRQTRGSTKNVRKGKTLLLNRTSATQNENDSTVQSLYKRLSRKLKKENPEIDSSTLEEMVLRAALEAQGVNINMELLEQLLFTDQEGKSNVKNGFGLRKPISIKSSIEYNELEHNFEGVRPTQVEIVPSTGTSIIQDISEGVQESFTDINSDLYNNDDLEDFFDSDNSISLSGTESTETINTERKENFINIIRKAIPGIKPEEIKFISIIEMERLTNGKSQFGAFIDNVVYITEFSNGEVPIKAALHEVVHKIFNQYLTPKERRQILKDMIRLMPEVEFMTLDEAEEVLADMWYDQFYYPNKILNNEVSWLNKFLRWLNRFFGFVRKNYSTVNDLFDDINSLSFNRTPINDFIGTKLISKIYENYEDIATYIEARTIIVSMINKLMNGKNIISFNIPYFKVENNVVKEGQSAKKEYRFGPIQGKYEIILDNNVLPFYFGNSKEEKLKLIEFLTDYADSELSEKRKIAHIKLYNSNNEKVKQQAAEFIKDLNNIYNIFLNDKNDFSLKLKESEIDSILNARISVLVKLVQSNKFINNNVTFTMYEKPTDIKLRHTPMTFTEAINSLGLYLIRYRNVLQRQTSPKNLNDASNAKALRLKALQKLTEQKTTNKTVQVETATLAANIKNNEELTEADLNVINEIVKAADNMQPYSADTSLQDNGFAGFDQTYNFAGLSREQVNKIISLGSNSKNKKLFNKFVDIINKINNVNVEVAKTTALKQHFIYLMNLGVQHNDISFIIEKKDTGLEEETKLKTKRVNLIKKLSSLKADVVPVSYLLQEMSIERLEQLVKNYNSSNPAFDDQINKKFVKKLLGVSFPRVNEIVQDIYPVVSKASTKKEQNLDEDLDTLYEEALSGNTENRGVLEYILEADQVNYYSKLSRAVKDSLSAVFYEKNGQEILVPPSTAFAKMMDMLEGVSFIGTKNEILSQINNNTKRKTHPSDLAVKAKLIEIIQNATATDIEGKIIPVHMKFVDENTFIIAYKVTDENGVKTYTKYDISKLNKIEIQQLRKNNPNINIATLEKGSKTNREFFEYIINALTSNFKNEFNTPELKQTLTTQIIGLYNKKINSDILAQTFSSIASLRSKNLYMGIKSKRFTGIDEDADFDIEDLMNMRSFENYEYFAMSSWGDESVARNTIKDVIKQEILNENYSLVKGMSLPDTLTSDQKRERIKQFLSSLGIILESEIISLTNTDEIYAAIQGIVSNSLALKANIDKKMKEYDSADLAFEERDRLIENYLTDINGYLSTIKSIKVQNLANQKSNSYIDGKGKRRWKRLLSDNVYDLINKIVKEFSSVFPDFFKSAPMDQHNIFNPSANSLPIKQSIENYADHDTTREENSTYDPIEYIDEKKRDFYVRTFFGQFLSYLNKHGNPKPNSNNPLKYIQNFFINSNKKEARAVIIKILSNKFSLGSKEKLERLTTPEIVQLANELGIKLKGTSKDTTHININHLLEMPVIVGGTQFSTLSEYAIKYMIGKISETSQAKAEQISKDIENLSFEEKIKKILESGFEKSAKLYFIEAVLKNLTKSILDDTKLVNIFLQSGESKLVDNYFTNLLGQESSLLINNIRKNIMGSNNFSLIEFYRNQLKDNDLVKKYFSSRVQDKAKLVKNGSSIEDIIKNDFSEVGLAILSAIRSEANRPDPTKEENRKYRVKNYEKNWRKSNLAGLDAILTKEQLNDPNEIYKAVQTVYFALEDKSSKLFDALFEELAMQVNNNIFYSAMNRLVEAGLMNKYDTEFLNLPRTSQIERMKSNGTWSTEVQKYKEQYMPIITLFFMNNYINGYHLNNFFIGDQSFFAGAYDIIKRMSIFFATGTKGLVSPLVNAMPKTFRVAVLEDLKKTMDKSDWSEFKQLQDLDFEAWDGSGFMLPEWHEHLKNGFGSSMKLGYTMKPVYGGKDKYGIPRTMKYSQVVLTDELCEAFPALSKLRDAMRKNNVQEAVFASAFKVGAPTNLAKLKQNNDGSHYHEIIEDSIIELNSEFYRIQENPEKPADYSVSNPSQLMYFVDTMGRNTFEQMMVLTLMGKLMDLGFNNFMEEFEDAGYGAILKFKAKIAQSLDGVAGSERQHEMLTSKSKNQAGKLVDNVDINLPMLVTKMITQFSSLITKAAVSIKFKGGAYVLQSDYGKENGVAEVKDKSGKIVGTFTIYNIPEELKDTAKYSITYRDLKFNINEGYAEAVISQPYAEALGLKIGDFMYAPHKEDSDVTEMLGFRIPSTWLHSALPIKIIGFYPANKDTNFVIVPKEIVALHGSDYDVDKLYILRRERYEQDQTIVYNNQEYQIGRKKEAIVNTKIGNTGKTLMNVLEELIEIEKESYQLNKAKASKEANALLKTQIQNQIKLNKEKINEYSELYESLLKNSILETYLSVTKDPANRDLMYSPITMQRFKGKSSQGAEQTAVEIVEQLSGKKHKPNLDLNEIQNNQKMHEDNTTGLNVVGMAANAVKNIRYLIMGAQYRKDGKHVVTEMPEVDKSFGLNFNGYNYVRFSTTEKRVENGALVDNEVVIGFKDGNPVKHTYALWETLDSIINAAIDNVKEQILYHLNITNNTIKSWATMLAFGLPMPVVLKFHLQPVMLELAKQSYPRIDKIVKRLHDMYKASNSGVSLTSDEIKALTEETITTEEMENPGVFYNENFFSTSQPTELIRLQLKIAYQYLKMEGTIRNLKYVQNTLTPLTGGVPYLYSLLEDFITNFRNIYSTEEEQAQEDSVPTDNKQDVTTELKIQSPTEAAADDNTEEVEDKKLSGEKFSTMKDKIWQIISQQKPLNDSNKLAKKFRFKNSNILGLPVISNMYNMIYRAKEHIEKIFYVHNMSLRAMSRFTFARLNSRGSKFVVGKTASETRDHIRKEYVRYMLQGFKHFDLSNQKPVLYGDKEFYGLDAWNIQFIENLRIFKKQNPTNIFLSSIEITDKNGIPSIKYTSFGQLQGEDLWNYSKAFDELKFLSGYPDNLLEQTETDANGVAITKEVPTSYLFSVVQYHLLQYAVMNWGLDFGSSNYTLLMNPKMFKALSNYIKKQRDKANENQQKTFEDMLTEEQYNHFILQMLNNNADNLEGSNAFYKKGLLSFIKEVVSITVENQKINFYADLKLKIYEEKEDGLVKVIDPSTIDRFIILNDGGKPVIYKKIHETSQGEEELPGIYFVKVDFVKQSANYYVNNASDSIYEYSTSAFYGEEYKPQAIDNIKQHINEIEQGQTTLTISKKAFDSEDIVGKVVIFYDSNDITRKLAFKGVVTEVKSDNYETKLEIIKQIKSKKRLLDLAKQTRDKTRVKQLKQEIDELFKQMKLQETVLTITNAKIITKKKSNVEVENTEELQETFTDDEINEINDNLKSC